MAVAADLAALYLSRGRSRLPLHPSTSGEPRVGLLSPRSDKSARTREFRRKDGRESRDPVEMDDAAEPASSAEVRGGGCKKPKIKQREKKRGGGGGEREER